MICPVCRSPLRKEIDAWICDHCPSRYPIEDGIADFSRGEYFDSFAPGQQLPPDHLRALELEHAGAVRRINDFYLPLIRERTATRVLDCGCGNGVSVDLLGRAGYEAWGNDLSQLRKWQWRERERRDRLVVASGLALPFPDDYFDVVLSSGVIEHIGVTETPAPHYAVRALPDRDEQRLKFVAELMRVVAPNGRIFIDCPNGAFPIDFWHGNAPGTIRMHSLREEFLPTFGEIRALVHRVDPRARVRALSPAKRLQFVQASQRLHGKLLRFPMAILFRAMKVPGLRWIARSPLNPFLVVECGA